MFFFASDLIKITGFHQTEDRSIDTYTNPSINRPINSIRDCSRGQRNTFMSVKSIELELERPSGVFYAGEVVRGTVRLITNGEVTCHGSGEVKCRGLIVQMVCIVWDVGCDVA